MPSRKWTQSDEAKLKEMVSGLPEYLYRYSDLDGRKKEWMREVIVDSKLYFAQPSAFNDPLDCKTPPTFNASKRKIQSHWRNYVQTNHPDQKGKEHKKIIQQLIRDSRTEKGKKKLVEGVFRSIDKNGIVCFSRVPDSILMWSYYTNGHRGICLRFRTDPNFLVRLAEQLIPLEVSYADAFPEVNFYESGIHDFIKTILGTKAKAWEHEQEWRLILVNDFGKMAFPSFMLDGIILGMRIGRDDENTIKEWIGLREPHTQLLRVRNKERSFDLEIVAD